MGKKKKNRIKNKNRKFLKKFLLTIIAFGGILAFFNELLELIQRFF